jgi:hypothetical protein
MHLFTQALFEDSLSKLLISENLFSGKFGLWLDGDLYQGRTQPCSTYGNPALVDDEDFVVKAIECWAFI